jgi:hypothetical protein
MTIDSKHPAIEDQQVVLDVEGARDIGPIEADGLLRECIALTQQRLNAALARTLDQLQTAAPEPGDATLTSDLAIKLASAVRRERARFLPHFNAEFDRPLPSAVPASLARAKRAIAARSRWRSSRKAT